MFCCALLAHVLSLFFRFTLEQLTESKERQQKGKETSPAEQLGERGQAPRGPLSCKGEGTAGLLGTAPPADPGIPSNQNGTPQGPTQKCPCPAIHSVSSLTQRWPHHVLPVPHHLLLSLSYMLCRDPPPLLTPTHQLIPLPGCLFPVPPVPQYLHHACILFLVCLYTLGALSPHTRSHDELCAQLTPAYAVSAECF